jgi:hypothetical protein
VQAPAFHGPGFAAFVGLFGVLEHGAGVCGWGEKLSNTGAAAGF